MKRSCALSLVAGSLLSVGHFVSGQQVYTSQDYLRAESRLGAATDPLVLNTVDGIQYLADGRVFYAQSGVKGALYFVGDPARASTAPAFDKVRLTKAISAVLGWQIPEEQIFVSEYLPNAEGFSVTTNAGEFQCEASAVHCRRRPAPKRVEQPAQTPSGQPPATGLSATQAGGNGQMSGEANSTQVKKLPPKRARAARSKAPFDLSPDKTQAAFIRDWNLWVRDEATGEERQLTRDGVTDFGYATDNAGWQHSDAPIVVWSPDSKKIATFQQDQRKVASVTLVPVTNRHAQPETWKYPFLGDKDVVMIQPVVIDVATGKVTRLKMDPEFHRSTLCDDVSCRGGAGWDDVQFAPDGRHLAIVSTSRDHKDAWLREADSESGEVRTVYHEHAQTYFESGIGKVNWRYMPESHEFLWFSQRSDWGQMYLYDLATGQLKNQVTQETGTVTQVLRVDEKARVLYFLATGKEPNQDPYYTHFYRVNFDGTAQQLLTPEIADHAVTPSPDGSSFVDIYSTAEMPQTAVLRDNTGKLLATLAKQDISRLTATGWKPPMPITVPARDGKTQIYGFLYRPSNFDPARKYAIVNYVYPGPFIGSCTAQTRSFRTAAGDMNALAELGFVVVCVDGMGTPYRSKSFQDAYADTPAGLAEDTIPDQVAAIKALAARYAWVDVSRVGIWGHSGGGNATVSAMFHYPEFFKVGVAESGNHDNRDYEDDWDEKYGGLEVIGPDGKSNYDVQANQNFAANLKGKLLLAHGTMDDNVPPNNTLMVVDALIKANKDFDLLMIPNAHHGYGAASSYMMRRRWDYFVKNLAGGTPPENYRMKGAD